MRKVSDWTGEDVVHWLGDQGLQEYCDSLGSLSGRALLGLSQSDFASPPLSLVTSDGGKQLLECVQTLRIQNHIRAHQDGPNGHAPNGTAAPGVSVNGDAGHAPATLHHGVSNGNGPPKPKTLPAQRNGIRDGPLLANGFGADLRQEGDAWIRIPLPAPGASSPSSLRPPLPEEWGRTGVALAYALTCFVLTSVMISVVHERVPPKEDTPPLPDKFFDWFDRKEWAFLVCEVIGLGLVASWLILWALHKHRSIVGRRFFFIIGTLYLYRCVTMYITTLPVPGLHFRCAPKMMAGGGLTITGSHHMCGDYLYSGHTVLLTLSYLFIKEYSPRRMWWFHCVCWLLCGVGLFCILLAHDHYSIDVVVAYYVTTQLFWLYHTMANQQVLKAPSQNNFVSRVWWYGFFLYLEAHVQSPLPRLYQLPPSLRRLMARGQARYSRLADSQCP
ncbi:hypothetical protein NHX12_024868 [Muraenolepis orangiensis]|uniref:Phosphatidylcholine:ceramide cholinephosphotransferase 1 n=1 Tax=Muraenolepis orangiensis TaxID=630683 RepID=A0A9Q0ENZ7_9TELE|nr:hypothetical protein NHX12_024868 [Muraenolepis orangiensis]